MAQDVEASNPIRLSPMAQLVEATDKEDDWTGITNTRERKKRQTRLNVRAYRRRRALNAQAQAQTQVQAALDSHASEPAVPCWDEDWQDVALVPASVAAGLYRTRSPLIPRKDDVQAAHTASGQQRPATRLVFPLCPDHLIILLQFNVLRASMANRRLLAPLESLSPSSCSTSTTHVLARPPDPSLIPPSLYPTALQQTVPHEDWVDIIPHPTWRDNAIRAAGSFDEDELWSDVIGGLFEGFPDDEVEHRGLVAWDPPWDVSGWEISEGFWRKWGWTFKGCDEVLLQTTNRWREMRGVEPLVWEVESE